MIKRYAITAVAGFSVTFALFFLMQFLIQNAGKSDQDKIAYRPIEFVRTLTDTETQSRVRKLPEKLDKDTPPPTPDIDLKNIPKPSTGGLTGTVVSIPEVTMVGGPAVGGAPSDGEILPLVRIEPRYPGRALSRGIEGWVQLEFTVSPTGTVIDPVVVDSEPSSIFNRAAINAVKRWKYKPKVINGVPVPREGVQVVLTFKIAGEGRGR